MPKLEFETRRLYTKPPVTVVEVSGFIDAHTAAEFESAVQERLGTGASLGVIDLHGVDYVNSSAIGSLLSLRDAVKRDGGMIALSRVSRDVGFIMQTMGVVALFPVFARTEEAAAYLGKASRNGGAGTPPPPAFESRSVAPTPGGHTTAWKPDDASVIMVLPAADRFSSVLTRRLRTPKGRCEIVRDCRRAEARIGNKPPELVILDDRCEGGDAFLTGLKVARGGALVSVVKLYPNGADVTPKGPFKVWEDDYLVQPYEMSELFIMAEEKIREVFRARRKGHRRVHFNFQSTKAQHERAVELFASLLPLVGFYSDEATAFAAAFRESVDNAIRHGNKSKQYLRVDVRCTVTPGALTVRVQDEGDGFDYSYFLGQARAVDTGEASRQRRMRGVKGGLGIMLMSRTTDSLTFERPGNVAVLKKTLPKADKVFA